MGKPDKPKPTPPTSPTLVSGACEPEEKRFTEGVRYVRLNGPKINYNYLQISQVVVLDTNGKNVAANKPATMSSKYIGQGFMDPKWAVDGKENLRCGYVEKVVIVEHYPMDKNPNWMVDLEGEFDIKQIKYYNRGPNCWGFRANGVEIQLLDSEKNVIKSYKTTNVQNIYCVNTI